MSPSLSPTVSAIVTGASSGLGREIARLLAARGLHLVLVARRTARLEELRAELTDVAPCTILTLDLCEPEALGASLASLKGVPPVEVLVNNAGYGLYAPFLDVPPEETRRLMEIHYFAAAAAVRTLLPGMLSRGRGHVINVASISTKMGPWGHSGYTAAKSALVALTQSLSAEYRSRGVNFSYVNPGIVQTEYFDHPSYAPLQGQVRRHGIAAAAAARQIVGLLDRPRIELCIPRHYRVLDWIRAISPDLAHWLVTRESRPSVRRDA